jgi:hypothetical protein
MIAPRRITTSVFIARCPSNIVSRDGHCKEPLRFRKQQVRDIDVSRAQEPRLEAAAQKWVIASSLADYIARQGSVVTKKRAIIPVVMQSLQVTHSLERTLDGLGRLSVEFEGIRTRAAYVGKRDFFAKRKEAMGERGYPPEQNPAPP